jgi:D-xylose transport system ATP-binding protein
MTQALLECVGITKRFGAVVALRDVSFDLRPGEIHALCGENGAGKSTLIKTLGGIHPHGSFDGELRIDGRPARLRHTADARDRGIAVIYQELALVNEMTVAEIAGVTGWSQSKVKIKAWRARNAMRRVLKTFL